jgi:hypothetical protein
MIYVLNNMTSDYDPQLVKMQKRVIDKLNPLICDEIRDERLNMKAKEEN